MDDPLLGAVYFLRLLPGRLFYFIPYSALSSALPSLSSPVYWIPERVRVAYYRYQRGSRKFCKYALFSNQVVSFSRNPMASKVCRSPAPWNWLKQIRSCLSMGVTNRRDWASLILSLLIACSDATGEFRADQLRSWICWSSGRGQNRASSSKCLTQGEQMRDTTRSSVERGNAFTELRHTS